MCHFACTSLWGSLTVWSDDQNQLSGVGFPGRLDEHHNLQNRKEASGLHSCGAQSQSMALHLLRPLWVTSPAQGYSCSKPYQNLQFPPPSPPSSTAMGGYLLFLLKKPQKLSLISFNFQLLSNLHACAAQSTWVRCFLCRSKEPGTTSNFAARLEEEAGVK